MPGLPAFFGSAFLAFCFMISYSFYLIYQHILLVYCKFFRYGLVSWLYLGYRLLLTCRGVFSFLCWFLFLFLLFSFLGFCQTEFFKSLLEISQIIFLFLWFLLLFWLLWLLDGGLLDSRLGLLLCLFFLIAFLISKIEGIGSSVEMEFFFFEFFRFESTFDSFHVPKATSEMFFGIERLDSRLLFILFIIGLRFLFGWFLILRAGFWLFMIRLLFFRFWVFFIRRDVGPETLWDKWKGYFWLIALGGFWLILTWRNGVKCWMEYQYINMN